MPTIHTRQSQIQHKSTFITGDNHYVLFYKISFRTDQVNLSGFGFNESAEKGALLLRSLHHIIYFRVLLHNLSVQFWLYLASLVLQKLQFSEGRFDQTCQVYGCVGHRVKPKAFVQQSAGYHYR